MTIFSKAFVKKMTLALAATVCFAAPARAARFANQFCEFELPPQWQCKLEGAEWVCQSSNEAKQKDAIIVLAAKLKGDQDSLDQYLEYLKNAKTFTSIQNKVLKSEPKYAKTVSLSGQPWVDSLHLESEIPGFYTRYLATVKQDIGVLVTYSINKAKYQEYLDEFENMVKTLKVFRKPGGGLNAANTNLFANTQIPQTVEGNTVFPGVNPQGGSDNVGKPKQQQELPILPLALAAGAIGFFIWRKRQRQG